MLADFKVPSSEFCTNFNKTLQRILVSFNGILSITPIILNIKKASKAHFPFDESLNHFGIFHLIPKTLFL
jgi:hypothetical protein